MLKETWVAAKRSHRQTGEGDVYGEQARSGRFNENAERTEDLETSLSGDPEAIPFVDQYEMCAQFTGELDGLAFAGIECRGSKSSGGVFTSRTSIHSGSAVVQLRTIDGVRSRCSSRSTACGMATRVKRAGRTCSQSISTR